MQVLLELVALFLPRPTMSAVPPEALHEKLKQNLTSFKHAVRSLLTVHPFLSPADMLGPTQEIIDSSSGCGMSYSIVVVADDFEGLNTLKRNRLGSSFSPCWVHIKELSNEENPTPFF